MFASNKVKPPPKKTFAPMKAWSEKTEPESNTSYDRKKPQVSRGSSVDNVKLFKEQTNSTGAILGQLTRQKTTFRLNSSELRASQLDSKLPGCALTINVQQPSNDSLPRPRLVSMPTRRGDIDETGYYPGLDDSSSDETVVEYKSRKIETILQAENPDLSISGSSCKSGRFDVSNTTVAPSESSLSNADSVEIAASQRLDADYIPTRNGNPYLDAKQDNTVNGESISLQQLSTIDPELQRQSSGCC